MSQPRSRRRVPAVLAACVAIMFAAMTSTWASVISSTPTLPVLGVAYTSSGGVGCFPAAGVCVAPGTFVLTSVVSSTFDGTGQDIIADLSYASTLTTLANVPIGPVSLSGTMEQEVLGRTSSTELGTWAIQLDALSLSGPVLGHTLTLTLDGSTPSTGGASIVSVGNIGNEPMFRIDSFFDVFVELSLDTTPPLDTTRAVHLSLGQVPEPASLVLLGFGFAGLAWSRRRSV